MKSMINKIKLQKHIPAISANHYLCDTDITHAEIIKLFDFAALLKNALKTCKIIPLLKGDVLGMIFEKSSTRTRVSFEAGITRLGGSGIFLSKNDIQIGRGEPISDTAKVLSRFVNIIMIRTFEQSKLEELSANSTVPVINGLSDTYHPCQALADYFTIYERNKHLKHQKIAYIGDGNNVANSLLLTGSILGINVSIASPKGYQIKPEIADIAVKNALVSGSKLCLTDSVEEAANSADYLYTDVWTSMGQESENRSRIRALKNFKISRKLIEKCSPKAKVMHCLPAHRGEEIDADVIDSDYSIVFDEAENRMHAQNALMCALLKNYV